MFKFATNLTFMYADSPFLERIARARASGFRSIEFHNPYPFSEDPNAIVEAITRHGVEGEALKRVLVAYEPVWAIGEHGTPATPDYADWIHRAISAALPVPVLYGGSVDESNSLAFAGLPSVAGLFIGRSAWNVEGFLRIVKGVTLVRFGAG